MIIDIVSDDPRWADWSIAILEQYADEELSINSAIYAELCFDYGSVAEVDYLIRQFRLNYLEIPRDGLFRAAKAFKAYKGKGGTKDFVLPDFFIGGHAESANSRLITRDVKRYRSYFPSVSVIHP
ncbi:MAG: type II toxin-antitoxin system VapC family toxin [Verrucomicrobiales bacterium]|nr:type II toxin-antitoxin system VapC family toxin [Verrucomicrobiales bacterium]